MTSFGEKTLSLCVVAALAGAAAWHYSALVPPAHVAVGLDPSLSVERNCSGLVGAAKQLMARNGVRDGSTLSFLLMGNQPGDPEPELRFMERIPFPPDSVYGGSKHRKEFEEAEGRLHAELEQACEAAEDARHSPIYQLVRQGIEHLRSEGLGCGRERSCYFVVKTDLDEDVHPVLRAALEAAAKSGTASVPAELAASIENFGIEVEFCGLAEIKPLAKKTSASAPPEIKAKVWRELFTDPARVSFRPFCSPQQTAVSR